MSTIAGAPLPVVLNLFRNQPSPSSLDFVFGQRCLRSTVYTADVVLEQ